MTGGREGVGAGGRASLLRCGAPPLARCALMAASSTSLRGGRVGGWVADVSG